MWKFIQSTGEMIAPDGEVFNGYAGNGPGLNNPAMQNVPKVGPLPVGQYTIGELESSHGHLGTNVAALIQSEANDMFGRSAFYIHGRKGPDDMDASEGCIVMDHDDRMKVLTSADRQLVVVAYDGTDPPEGPPGTGD